MFMTICHHICYFGFAKENKDIFLLDDHIWKCQNLNDRISYFVQILRIFQTYYVLSNDKRMNVEILHIKKIVLSRSGLLTGTINRLSPEIKVKCKWQHVLNLLIITPGLVLPDLSKSWRA